MFIDVYEKNEGTTVIHRIPKYCLAVKMTDH